MRRVLFVVLVCPDGSVSPVNSDHCTLIPVCCVQAQGFELSYLEKVVEVKDTVHRKSLLHHTCNLVVDNYPESSDVYSEVPAITRSAKVRGAPPQARPGLT